MARTHAAQAQVCLNPNSIGDFDAELLRSASLLGRAEWSLGVVQRISSMRVRANRCINSDIAGPAVSRTHPAYQYGLLPAELATAYNSAYPRDRNNGVLWSGRGTSSAFSAGFFARASIVSAAVAPVFTWSANAAFPLATSLVGTYGAPWMSGIDWPQRFGDRAYDRVDLGASYVRIDASGLAIGVSNENLWWGPQRVWPLIMSNSAPGFPHVFVGTSRPVDIGIGHIEGEVLWGRLAESEVFDTDATNDRRLFAGAVLGFEPRGLDGFTIGFTRAYHAIEPPGGFTFTEALRASYTKIGVNAGRDNNLLSIFARWAMTPAGFEVYGEWGRDDHWSNARDLLGELDHSQAYALGLQQVIARASEWYRVYAELVHLESAMTLRGGRGIVTFYTNTAVTQGHTQRGQLLGAWTGPGSDAQLLGIDRIEGLREMGFYLQRTRYNTDAYYTSMAPRYGSSGHDLELTAAARYSGLFGGLRFRSELGLSRRWNRAFVDLSNGKLNQAQWNVGFTLQALWRPH